VVSFSSWSLTLLGVVLANSHGVRSRELEDTNPTEDPEVLNSGRLELQRWRQLAAMVSKPDHANLKDINGANETLYTFYKGGCGGPQ